MDEIIKVLRDLIIKLDEKILTDLFVIPYATPILSFGDFFSSDIATLGLNPSNLEFVDNNGKELPIEQSRFFTLNTLGLNSWSELNNNHLQKILQSYSEYFSRNPYDSWFKRLDNLISGTGSSFYFPSFKACHLDLVPFATYVKWGNMNKKQQNLLLNYCVDVLGVILKNSQIKTLVLNGQAVNDTLQLISGETLQKKEMTDWLLPRRGGNGVKGYSYTGVITKVGKIDIGRPINVLGYNHNIQSSYGITTNTQSSIKRWITDNINIVP